MAIVKVRQESDVNFQTLNLDSSVNSLVPVVLLWINAIAQFKIYLLLNSSANPPLW